MTTKPGEEATPANDAATIYDTLEDKLGSQIRQLAVDVKGLNRNLSENTLTIGAKLKTVQMLLQDKLPEGDAERAFLQWGAEDLPFKRTQMYNYMHVADRFATYRGFLDLSFDQTALFLVSAPKCPDGAVKQILVDAKKGVHITFQYAQKIIAAYKPAKVDPVLAPLPVGQYNVFWATPFAVSARDRKGAELLALPSNRHSTLYLWAPPEHLRDALALLDDWEFDYKTNLVVVRGSGDVDTVTHHIASTHTICLIATKGRGAPSATEEELGTPGIYSWYELEVEECAEHIVALHPKGKVLQLYSNVPAPLYEKWALWNHKSQEVESESAEVPVVEDDDPLGLGLDESTVPEEDEEGGDEPAVFLGDLPTPGPEEVEAVANVIEEEEGAEAPPF